MPERKYGTAGGAATAVGRAGSPPSFNPAWSPAWWSAGSAWVSSGARPSSSRPATSASSWPESPPEPSAPSWSSARWWPVPQGARSSRIASPRPCTARLGWRRRTSLRASQHRSSAPSTGAAASGLEVGAGQTGAALTLPSGTPPGVAATVAALAHRVFTEGCVTAMKPTLMLPIGVLVLAAIASLWARGRGDAAAEAEAVPAPTEAVA